MITRVVYNNKAFKIIDEYSIKFSNNEVTFNDIKIDFTNRSIADIPYKYQEIKIMQAKYAIQVLLSKAIIPIYNFVISFYDNLWTNILKSPYLFSASC